MHCFQGKIQLCYFLLIYWWPITIIILRDLPHIFFHFPSIFSVESSHSSRVIVTQDSCNILTIVSKWTLHFAVIFWFYDNPFSLFCCVDCHTFFNHFLITVIPILWVNVAQVSRKVSFLPLNRPSVELSHSPLCEYHTRLYYLLFSHAFLFLHRLNWYVFSLMYLSSRSCRAKEMLQKRHKELSDFYWKASRAINIAQDSINYKSRSFNMVQINFCVKLA